MEEKEESTANWTSKRLILALAMVLGGLLGTGLCQQPGSDSLRVADIQLQNAPLEGAVALVGRLFDLPIVSAGLPDLSVSLDLRGVTADEALSALQAVGGLSITHRPGIVLIQPAVEAAPEVERPLAQRFVVGPFSPAAEELFAVAANLGVQAEYIHELLVTLEGPAERLEAVAFALEQLRRQQVETRVFRLGYARGEEVLAAVNSQLDPELERAQYDAPDNLLSVSALPSTLTQIEAVVAEFERGLPQIEIEARILEVSTSDLERIGVEWQMRAGLRGGSLPSSFFLKGVGDSKNFLPSPTEAVELQNTGNTDSGSSGVDSAFQFHRIDFRDATVLLEMLERSGETKVLANPRVTTLHNRPATIRALNTLLLPRFTRSDAFATTSISGIDTVYVGTTLTVTPRLDSEGRIFLRVVPEVSELIEFRNDLPVTSLRSAATEVILHDGESFVIGGMIRERERSRTQKLPFLGDIPLLGRLFRFDSDEVEQTELMIFLTPHVLPDPETRRRRIRVDGFWLDKPLAAALGEAREQVAADEARWRTRGVTQLRQLDAALLRYGLDVEQEIWELRTDPAEEVRLEVAFFFARRRPDKFFELLPGIGGNQRIAVALQERALAPHIHLCLAALLVGSPGGTELLRARLQSTDVLPSAQGRLLRALALADPGQSIDLADSLLVSNDHWVVASALDALAMAQSDVWRPKVAHLADGGTLELQAYARNLLAGLFEPSGALEQALNWSAPATDIDLLGPPEFQERVREALQLLQTQAPDYHQFVVQALARIQPSAATSWLIPEQRELRLSASESARAARLAHRLVHYSSRIYDARVLGFPVDGPRALARSVRLEIDALSRLSGERCERSRIDAMVEEVLTLESALPGVR